MSPNSSLIAMIIAELSVEPVKPKLTLFIVPVENVMLRRPLAALLSVWAMSPSVRFPASRRSGSEPVLSL